MRLTTVLLITGLIALIACSGDSDNDENKVSAEEQSKLDSLATIETDENLIDGFSPLLTLNSVDVV